MRQSYSKWYASHRRFSFTAKYCIDLYETTGRIPDTIFKPFLRSLACHSKSEERMFRDVEGLSVVFTDHTAIVSSKVYSDDEKYELCSTLLPHMKEEERIVSAALDQIFPPTPITSESFTFS